MTYLKTISRFDGPEFPMVTYAELDDLRWEVRKVVIFADGSKGYADKHQEVGPTGGTLNTYQEVGPTGLAEKRIPPLDEFFHEKIDDVVITKEEFERVWSNREVAEESN